jgi:hypothetical protein
VEVRMSETITPTWFDHMAGAVVELEMLSTVVDAGEVVHTITSGDPEDVANVHRWVRNSRAFLEEIHQALTEVPA